MSVTQIRGNTQIISNTIDNSRLLNLTIDNSKVSATAAIAYSKLALSNSIVNADINSAAAIAYSKLSLTGSIINADINASAAIAYSKLNLSTSIVNADIAAAAAIAFSKLAALTVSRALVSDGSGVVSVSTTTAAELAFLSGVTSSVQTQIDSKVAKAGDTMSGNLAMGGNKVTGLGAASTNGDAVRFEQAVLTDGSHAITGNQSFSGTAKITNLLDPTLAQDGATKAYVDNAVAGLSWKQAARAASTANVSIASAPASIDGVTLVSGNRVLLKNQTLPETNGIYIFNGAASALTRSTDADTWAEIVGLVLYIEEGTANLGSKWVNTNVDGGTLETTAITFTTFAASSSIDGTGTAGYNAYWTATQTLAAEQYVAATRGGLATDASAFTGVVKASAGVFSASTIVNADVNASAGIVYSKLNLTGSIVNADVNASAAIAYSKLNLTTSIVNADISASAAIVYSKLSLSNSIVDADIASAAAISFSKLASLATGHILAGNAGVVTDVTMSGDATIGATGVVSISGGITNHVVTREVPSGTVDGSNAVFTLASTPLTGQESVYVNGILQNLGGSNDYTISSATITFNTAPSTGDVVLVSYFK
jgi:hypothetical protein